MELKNLDLNLLLVFHQMLQDRNTSIAAAHLGVTQPAVSNALKRLRRLLNDDLFLKTAKGMEPTPYALHLSEPIMYALNTLQTALATRDSFVPATSTRNFNLSLNDIGEMYFMPPLMKLLAEEAPHVSISTQRASTGHLQGQLASGEVDLALGLLPDLKVGVFRRQLFTHPYVCMFRRDHPVAGPHLTLETFCTLDHVGVIAANTGHEEIDDLLARAGVERKVTLRVPHFIAVAPILQSTDLIATVPQRFAIRCETPFGLMSIPHPVPLPDIAINMFWHAKFNRDPANVWLRHLFIRCFADEPT